MKIIEPWFGKWDEPRRFFHILSVEFEIGKTITSLDELEAFIRKAPEMRVELRHVDEPYGAAASLVQDLLQLLEALQNEFGPEHFSYAVLPREQVTLDFTKCKYIMEIYGEMRTKMEWADFYGENFDALWDILRGMPYKGDDFTIIRPVRFHGVAYGENEEFTEYVDKICDIFKQAQEQGNITVKIQYTGEEAGHLSDYAI